MVQECTAIATEIAALTNQVEWIGFWLLLIAGILALKD